MLPPGFVSVFSSSMRIARALPVAGGFPQREQCTNRHLLYLQVHKCHGWHMVPLVRKTELCTKFSSVTTNGAQILTCPFLTFIVFPVTIAIAHFLPSIDTTRVAGTLWAGCCIMGTATNTSRVESVVLTGSTCRSGFSLKSEPTLNWKRVKFEPATFICLCHRRWRWEVNATSDIDVSANHFDPISSYDPITCLSIPVFPSETYFIWTQTAAFCEGFGMPAEIDMNSTQIGLSFNIDIHLLLIMWCLYFPVPMSKCNGIGSIMWYVANSTPMEVWFNSEGLEDLWLSLDGNLIASLDDPYFVAASWKWQVLAIPCA